MLFQKKQIGYQGYSQTTGGGNHTKLMLLAGLVVFIVIVVLASLLTHKKTNSDNPAQHNPALAQYTSNSPGLQFSIYAPKDLELKNNNFNIVLNNPDSTQSVTISRFLASDGKDDFGKVSKSVLKDISGKDISGLKSERKTFYGKSVMVVTDTSDSNKQDYYIVDSGYIWLISVKWAGSEESLIKLAPEIATSLKVTQTTDKSNYLTE